MPYRFLRMAEIGGQSSYRMLKKVGGRKPIIVLSFVVVVAVFIALLHYLWRTNMASFWAIWITIGGSLILEMIYRFTTGRELQTVLKRNGKLSHGKS